MAGCATVVTVSPETGVDIVPKIAVSFVLRPIGKLTGPLTISAGETFTQALMGRMPRVIRIGDITQGVFSDVLGRRLPNGWRFALPNEVYLTPEDKAFDGTGIPPDIEGPVFTAADVAAGRDAALARALQLLARE